MAKDLRKDIETRIANNKVMMFSASYCPHCYKSKATLIWKGISYGSIEMDWAQDGKEMKDILEEMTGKRSLPTIFINGKHIGGNDDFQALNASGKLDELLK